jgi:hypothetical protein
MHFNLQELLMEADSLDELYNDFNVEEIDNIVKNLPLGKSPGPYGFNSGFLKKCSGVVSQDFYDLCVVFYNNSLCIRSINIS